MVQSSRGSPFWGGDELSTGKPRACTNHGLPGKTSSPSNESPPNAAEFSRTLAPCQDRTQFGCYYGTKIPTEEWMGVSKRFGGEGARISTLAFAP